jgi:hypothetical protein
MSAKHKPSERRFRLEEHRLQRRLLQPFAGLNSSDIPVCFLRSVKRLFRVDRLSAQQENLVHGENLPSLSATNNFSDGIPAAGPKPCAAPSVSF